MVQPRVMVLRAPGTNCDQETAFAFEQAGGHADVLHVNRLLENPTLAQDYQILCVPGGFSYGDDVAAGRILGNLFQHHLKDAMTEFKAAGKLILGICNGFQVLIKSGVLLTDDQQGPPATLCLNDTGRYEDRWVHLAADGDKCVFLRGLDKFELPVAHAEGQFVARNETELTRLADAGQLVLRYINPTGSEDVPFPHNPNGSQANVAGICDETGRVLGLMPHPERNIDSTHHPQWTRRPTSAPGEGLKLFQNAVAYFQS
ncbi:MAG: phosphoribosylformylglycinamidine synthase I [Candidatus Anammoximicrobium sp.]|nr:phosphoribosylformylglycinamidine synthase I [Candidatus Anammoximicrobium sp.]